MHLVNNVGPDICCFAVTRFISSTTKGYWNGVKHILEYPRRSIHMSLFYFEESKSELIDNADAKY